MSYIERIKRILYDELENRTFNYDPTDRRVAWDDISEELTLMASDITKELYPTEGGDDEDEAEEEDEGEPGEVPGVWEQPHTIPAGKPEPLVPEVWHPVAFQLQRGITTDFPNQVTRMLELSTFIESKIERS